MRKINLHQVDAFTDQLFGGNPTATVTNGELLTVEEKISLAKEMNYSETGFVEPSENADFYFHYFTRNGSKISFCGHATVGVPEDPFTGSLQGPLAEYLNQANCISANAERIRVEQGHFIERPGFVEIELRKKEGKVAPKLYARGVHLFSTTMEF